MHGTEIVDVQTHQRRVGWCETFGTLNREPVWEQQKPKLNRIQKLLSEVTVIRDM